VLRDGEPAALWRSRKSGRTLALRIEPIERLTASDRTAIDVEAEPLGPFRGCTVTEVTFEDGP
jgi:hypothetical protein